MKALISFVFMGLWAALPAQSAETPWTVRADMPTARVLTAAVEIDGLIYVIGGKGPTGSSGAVEVYDPAVDRWSVRTSMPTPRACLAAGVVDGKIYAIGGIDYGSLVGFGGTGQAHDAVEIYDLATDTWTAGTPMPQALGEAAVGVVDGQIYILGGAEPRVSRGDANELTAIRTARRYDPGTDTWNDLEDLPLLTRRMGYAQLAGRIYLVDGASFGSTTAALRAYDPDTRTLEFKSRFVGSALAFPATVAFDGRLFVMGGNLGFERNAVSTHIYDSAADTWSTGPDLPQKRGGAAAVAHDQRVYVFGGTSNDDPNKPLGDVRASVYSLALALPTVVEASPQQAEAVAGRPAPVTIEAQLALAADVSPPALGLDLHPLGQDERIPLNHQGGGRYTLRTSVVAPVSGPVRLPVVIAADDGLFDALFDFELQVFPAEDLAVSAAWPVEATAEVEAAAFEGQAALRLPSRVNLTYAPTEPVPLLGYEAVRFRFHPDEATDFVTNRLGLTINGNNVSLLPIGELDVGLDLNRKEWQTVEVPLELLGLTAADQVESIQLSINMRGQTRVADVRLVAAEVEITAVVEQHQDTTPDDFNLGQNFPNPFNSGTVIRFALPGAEAVELAVYNLAGQRVVKLVDGQRAAGTYTVNWDGRDADGNTLASGLYLYRLEAGDDIQTRKLTLLR